MARLDRFFLPRADWPGPGQDRAALTGQEARHLGKVLRHKLGDRVQCFDGAGREGEFEILALAKDRAELTLVSVQEYPEPVHRPCLAVGWSKSARRGWLMEKAVELEAGELLFWRAERGQGSPPDDPKDSWNEKLIQAAKQCGNPWLPRLSCLGGVTQLAAVADRFSRCYVLYEGADAQVGILGPEHFVPGPALLVIGPEGGLTEAEVAVLTGAGMRPLSLGQRVLRYETAALVALSLGYIAGQQSSKADTHSMP